MAPAVTFKLLRIAIMALACKAEIRWKQGLSDDARDLLSQALAFRDNNKVDIHIMESAYLVELTKKWTFPRGKSPFRLNNWP